MTFKEYLLSIGLSEEQANKTVEGMPANKFHLASEENLDSRYTKLKEQKEQLESDLNSANELVTGLQKSNKDVEGLQTKISEYQSKVETLETERAAEQKTYALKEALTKEGVSDVDYMLFKLGDVEVDKDGNLKGLDNRIKELKESNPTFFGADSKKDDQPGAAGYKPIDNKLDNGKQSVSYSHAELENLSAKEITENWDAVAAALENGGNE
ncbi:phage scaffolding protein [Desemzia sp. FAM 23989]|uniref:phage scaffolding protein n=1 Tax=Desemzia sp. FAM 23989 TaxID=3259523 RepID=UPI003887B00C